MSLQKQRQGLERSQIHAWSGVQAEHVDRPDASVSLAAPPAWMHQQEKLSLLPTPAPPPPLQSTPPTPTPASMTSEDAASSPSVLRTLVENGWLELPTEWEQRLFGRFCTLVVQEKLSHSRGTRAYRGGDGGGNAVGLSVTIQELYQGLRAAGVDRRLPLVERRMLLQTTRRARNICYPCAVPVCNEPDPAPATVRAHAQAVGGRISFLQPQHRTL